MVVVVWRRRGKRSPTLRMTWCGWYPARPAKDFAFWYRVAERVRDKRIRHKNMERIIQVCIDIDKETRT